MNKKIVRYIEMLVHFKSVRSFFFVQFSCCWPLIS